MKFPKETKKPEKGWKSSLAFGSGTKDHIANASEKVRKPISPIGKRTKERIRDNGTESELFKRIWEERAHICVVTLKHVPEPRPECFAHLLGKGRYPELRYNHKNIAIVYGIEEHRALDAMNKGRDAELINEILG